MRNFQLPGRSPAYGTRGMAATSHPTATQVAVEILRRGGNAVDAAVAAVAVLGVVEPHMTGIGGDCFAIIAEPDGSVHGLNASGRAPRAADLGYFLERGITAIAEDDIHAITVPGAVAGWEALVSGHGRLGLDAVLQPAIEIAEAGFAVAPRVAEDWGRLELKLKADSGASRHYLYEGRRAPFAGEVMAAPALAATLKAIAKDGARAFYEGPIAEEIVATVQARGGLLTLDDLAANSVGWVEPVRTGYRGLEVAELPPNGQGIAALILLNILENFEFLGLDRNGPERLHLEIEAARLAYGCRDAFIADPAAMTVAVADLIGKAYGRRLAERIDPTRRRPELAAGLPIPGADTVYLTVADADGRAVSLINSLFHGFGSGVVTPNSGVTLQNRGACFVVEEGHPNAIGPGKLPLHTIIPGMAFRDGQWAISFGVMGGAYQAAGHAHFISNVVDYFMDVQAAIDAPRLFWNDAGRIGLEDGLSEITLAGLARMGHGAYRVDQPWGGGQAIEFDRKRGVYIGGSDPRKDGCALGY